MWDQQRDEIMARVKWGAQHDRLARAIVFGSFGIAAQAFSERQKILRASWLTDDQRRGRLSRFAGDLEALARPLVPVRERIDSIRQSLAPGETLTQDETEELQNIEAATAALSFARNELETP